MQWGIRFLTKIHICKKPEQWQASAETTIEHFHGSLMDLVHHPMHLLAQLVISVVEMSCLMVVPLLVYRAMGLTGTPWYHVLTVSFLLFVSASYTPCRVRPARRRADFSFTSAAFLPAARCPSRCWYGGLLPIICA